MNVRLPVLGGLVAGLVLLAGCQRLNFEKDYKVEPLGDQILTFDPPRYEQKVTVEVKSPGVPVTVYLVKASDAEKARGAMQAGKAPEGALGGKDKGEDVNFTATVPAGTEYSVVLYNHEQKEASAKVKVTGR